MQVLSISSSHFWTLPIILHAIANLFCFLFLMFKLVFVFVLVFSGLFLSLWAYTVFHKKGPLYDEIADVWLRIHIMNIFISENAKNGQQTDRIKLKNNAMPNQSRCKTIKVSG